MIVIIFIALLFVGRIQGQELPSHVQALKKSYEQAVERATTPLTAKYLAELEKLRRQTTREEEATAISAEIDSIKVNATKSMDVAMSLREKLMKGIWLGTEKNLNKWAITFLPTGGIDMTRPDGSQGFTGWSWVIDDRNDLYITITGAIPQKVEISKRADSMKFSWGTLIKQK